MNPQTGRPAGGSVATSHPPERATQAITRAEFLPESMRIHFFCHRPWGTSDEQSVLEVSYAAVPALPTLPVDQGHGEFRETWEESVYVPTPQVTVFFRFARWQETDDCRMEALVGGPYLARSGASGNVRGGA